MNQEETREIQTSILTAEELRAISKRYTADIARLMQEFYNETTFLIEQIKVQKLYHEQTEGNIPTEVELYICPARSYYK